MFTVRYFAPSTNLFAEDKLIETDFIEDIEWESFKHLKSFGLRGYNDLVMTTWLGRFQDETNQAGLEGVVKRARVLKSIVNWANIDTGRFYDDPDNLEDSITIKQIDKKSNNFEEVFGDINQEARRECWKYIFGVTEEFSSPWDLDERYKRREKRSNLWTTEEPVEVSLYWQRPLYAHFMISLGVKNPIIATQGIGIPNMAHIPNRILQERLRSQPTPFNS